VQPGPKVALINEDTASDGDIFANAFRQWKIGALIGKRTWGGVIGIDDHGPLLDGGTVFVPEFGRQMRTVVGSLRGTEWIRISSSNKTR